jgi:signal peptidase II
MAVAERAGQHRLFLTIAVAVIALDVATKTAAASALTVGVPHDVLGAAVRLALVYNPGAAFGLSFGSRSREIFLGLTVTALVCLAGLHWTTRPGHMARTLAIGLVCGGAVGNLIDRVRSPAGVVDFIDVGVNYYRWPTFNVADMAVTTGAILLAWVLWMEDRVRDGGTTPVPEM